MKSKGKLLEKIQENIFLSVLCTKKISYVAVQGLWEKNTQKSVSKNVSNRNGNAKLLFPKEIILHES